MSPSNNCAVMITSKTLNKWIKRILTKTKLTAFEVYYTPIFHTQTEKDNKLILTVVAQ